MDLRQSFEILLPVPSLYEKDGRLHWAVYNCGELINQKAIAFITDCHLKPTQHETSSPPQVLLSTKDGLGCCPKAKKSHWQRDVVQSI